MIRIEPLQDSEAEFGCRVSNGKCDCVSPLFDSVESRKTTLDVAVELAGEYERRAWHGLETLASRWL